MSKPPAWLLKLAKTPLRGVISAITPFNHPLNMVSHKLAPAIATNNRVVLKPTELTPLTALALADVLYEAGLPPEMLSVVIDTLPSSRVLPVPVAATVLKMSSVPATLPLTTLA